MTKRTEVILAVSILVLLILVIGFFLLQGKKTPVVQTNTNTPTVTGTGVPEVPPASIPKNTTVSAGTVSKMFVERLGSYSSESDFANIDDILSLATASFQNSLKKIANDARAKAKADDAYYGISTRVISQTVKEETDTTAVMKLTTQRSESIGSPGNTTVRYQDITVNLVKEGTTWKVSGFTWAD